MSGLRKITLILLFLLLTYACRVRPEVVVSGPLPAVATDTANVLLAQRIDNFIQTLVPHSFNGAVVIGKEGALILTEGYGRAQAQKMEPFSTQTIIHTASFSQQITAVAFLLLQEQGALHLKDTLGQFFRAVPAEKRGITMQQLLTHTSGIIDYPVFLNTLKKKEFLEELMERPLGFRPGTGYQFSRAAYGLLAAVIEEASGEQYEVFVRRHLFEPAGMAQTGYVLPDFENLSLASARDPLPGAISLENYLALYPELWSRLGSTGMLSTAEDLYRWQKMLFRGKLLRQQTLSYVWENREGVPDGKSAYGWIMEKSTQGHPVLVHNSQEDGFACQLRFDPRESIFIVIVANHFNRQVEELGYQLGEMLYNRFYIPAQLPYSEESFVRMPQGPGTAHMRALMELITTEERSIPVDFMTLHYSADLRRSASERSHLNALQQLQERLAGARLIQSETHWPYFTLTYFAPEHQLTYILRVGVEPDASHQLNSIELDMTDTYP